MDSVETFVKLRYGSPNCPDYFKKIPADVIVKAYQDGHMEKYGCRTKIKNDQAIVDYVRYCETDQIHVQIKDRIHKLLIELHQND